MSGPLLCLHNAPFEARASLIVWLQISRRASPFYSSPLSPQPRAQGGCPTCHVSLQASQDLVASIPVIKYPPQCQVHLPTLRLASLPLAGQSHAAAPRELGRSAGSQLLETTWRQEATTMPASLLCAMPPAAAAPCMGSRAKPGGGNRGDPGGPHFPVLSEKLHLCSSNGPCT